MSASPSPRNPVLESKVSKLKRFERKQIEETPRTQMACLLSSVWNSTPSQKEPEPTSSSSSSSSSSLSSVVQEGFDWSVNDVLSLDYDPELNDGQDYGDEPNPKWPNLNPLQDALRSTATERARRVFGDFLEDFISLLFDCDQSLLQHQYPALFEYLSWRLLSVIDDPLGLPVFKVSKPAPGVMISDNTSELFCSFQQLVSTLPDYRLYELANIIRQRKIQLRSNTQPDARLLNSFKSLKRILKPITIFPSSSSSSASDRADAASGASSSSLVPRATNSKEIVEDWPLDVPELSWSRVVSSATDAKSVLLDTEVFGFRAEIGNTYTQEGWEQITTDFSIEDTPDDEPYYAKHFFSKEHSNFIGIDNQAGTFVLSVETQSKTPRALLRTIKRDIRMLLPVSLKLKDVPKAIKLHFPDVVPASLKFVPIKDEELDKQLLGIEQKNCNLNYKFGILYCKDNQIEENDMFGNAEGSENLNEFLDFIGQRVVLEGWQKYRGGLDVRNNSTGTHSVYTTLKDFEIMFHVSTLLPFYPADPQQLERKRHLGNDVVVLIFKEGSHKFSPDVIRSEFNHVFFVVQKEDQPDENGLTRYRVEVSCKDGVKRPFRPLLPSPPVFSKNEYFRNFLLTKLCNSEKAALHSPHFEVKLQRTRQMLLNNLAKTFMKRKDLEGFNL